MMEKSTCIFRGSLLRCEEMLIYPPHGLEDCDLIFPYISINLGLSQFNQYQMQHTYQQNIHKGYLRATCEYINIYIIFFNKNMKIFSIMQNYSTFTHNVSLY